MIYIFTKVGVAEALKSTDAAQKVLKPHQALAASSAVSLTVMSLQLHSRS